MGFESFFAKSCTAEEIQQTKERCDLILECKHQIEYWKSKLEALEDEQATFIKLARLRIDAPTTWRSLTRRERMEKRFILAALESPELPDSLAEFPSLSFPPHIRLDREILLARVKRPDFGRDLFLLCRSESHQEGDKNVMDRYFFVPPRLRNDKQVILAIIPKYPHVIECMGNNLRDDEEVLKELLSKHPGSTLPRNFIQHFSDRIRSSPRIMLDVVLQHPLGLPALGFCGKELRNDKSFILEAITCGQPETACESDTQVLRYASHRLRADSDVVDRAIAQSGLNLKYASYHLRRDRDLVVKASQQNGRAFWYCLPGIVKDELFDDRDFLLQVVGSTPNYVFKNCDECFHKDREFILKAAVHGLDWDLIPLSFQLDDDFLCEMIIHAPCRYMDLPEYTKTIPNVASAVFKADNPGDEELLEATERCPILLSDRAAMWVVANKAEIISETLQFSPMQIRGDKELMLKAVSTDPIVFDFCTEELQHDQDVILAAVPASLFVVTEIYQLENPDVVRKAIEKTEPNDLWMTYDDVYDSLWSNRQVAKAWLGKGGDWLHDDFPEEFKNDEELLLIVVKNNWSEFAYASDVLKNDKEFVLRALAIDARIIRDVSEELRYDYDVALKAFTHDCRAIQFYSEAEHFEFMVCFARWVRQQIGQHDAFTTEIVRSIVHPRVGDGKCQLGLLNQGPELVKFYTETLSSFLGLPDSKQLIMMEAASKNLLAWGL